MGFQVQFVADGGIFRDHSLQGCADLVFVGLVGGPDHLPVDGSGQFRHGQGTVGSDAGNAVQGFGVFQFHQSADFSSPDLRGIVAGLAQHVIHVSGFVLGVFFGDVKLHPGLQHSRKNPDIGIVAHIRIGIKLEDIAEEVAIGLNVEFLRLAFLQDVQGIGVFRGRKVLRNRVHKGQHAYPGMRGTDKGGEDIAVGDGFLHSCQQLLVGEFHVLQEAVQKLFVGLSHCFHQVLARFCNRVLHFRRNFAFSRGTDGFLADDVHHAFKCVFLADGDVNGCGFDPGVFVDVFQNLVEIRVLVVHAVHQDDLAYLFVLQLFHRQFQAYFKAGCCVDRQDHVFHRGNGHNGVTDEIGVARSVQDVDLVVFMIHPAQAQAQRHPLGRLFRIEVHHCVAFVDLADPVGGFGQIENLFGNGGLARSAGSHKQEIAQFLQVVFFHFVLKSRSVNLLKC